MTTRALPLLLLFLGCSSATRLARGQEPGVDEARMMRVAGALAHDSMQGRATGTEGGARARRLLLRELTARGVEPLLPAGFEQGFEFTGRQGVRRGVNLLGVIRGTSEPDRYIVVTAHYDHVGVRDSVVFNGADDNASGTTALLELAGWFQQHRPRHSIIVALLDAEETGLRGARAFLEKPPVPLDSIAVNVNLDMVGRNERNELWAVGTRHYPQLRPFVEEAAQKSALTLRLGHDGGTPGEQDWTGMSDQGPFHQQGIPFLYFGVEDHADYHRPTDDVEKLQPAFLAAAARTVLDVVALLDANLERIRR